MTDPIEKARERIRSKYLGAGRYEQSPNATDVAIAALDCLEATERFKKYHVRFEHSIGLVTPDGLPFYAVRKVYWDEFLEAWEEFKEAIND